MGNKVIAKALLSAGYTELWRGTDVISYGFRPPFSLEGEGVEEGLLRSQKEAHCSPCQSSTVEQDTARKPPKGPSHCREYYRNPQGNRAPASCTGSVLTVAPSS